MWDTLPSLDANALPAIYPEAAGRSASSALPADRSNRRRVAKRRAADSRKAENALQVLAPLPEVGEVLTVAQSGMSDGWDWIAGIVALVAPAQVEALTLTTLGFNERVIAGLADLLDRGRIRNALVMSSVYFRSVDSTLYDRLQGELTSRGQRLIARRNHAKLALFSVSDGRKYVWESSGNLRSCRNTEVATLTQDEGLHAFHQAWIDELLSRGNE